MKGTKQSGILNFKLANIIEDKKILEAARITAEKIIDNDPQLLLAEHNSLKNFLSGRY